VTVVQSHHRLPRAWYSASFGEFLASPASTVLGQLTHNSNVAVELTQKDAWEAQIGHLKSWLKGRSGFLLLEFNIPRMGLRADAVLLINGCVVILEFKVGGTITHQLDLNQVWEYALDTKNFHEPSHDLPVIPVLVPTALVSDRLSPLSFGADQVCEPFTASPDIVPRLLDELAREFPGHINDSEWTSGRYKPTPTIIEAARHLYANHKVAEIVHTEADEKSLSDTARRVEDLTDVPPLLSSRRL